jgi:50S ribosomal protein L16 3-hydroxylase
MKTEQAPLAVLGGMSAEQFLGEYWQQKPLLIRQAVPPAHLLLDANELAGLACEEGIESRIISGSCGDGDWQLEHGPFEEQTFDRLGDSDWTLLVQAVDHHIDEIARLKSHFRFIPDWRLDDIMVSFAAPGGSVGPHLDQYDVFLLQAEGRRRWQIGDRLPGQPALLPHPDLQLLQDFHCCDAYVLEAGDMLYLPPGVPHWGVALDACVTCSIGFRAPSHQEIISHYCDDVLAGIGAGRFEDPGRDLCANPGMIDQQALAQLRDLMGRLSDEHQLASWFGRYMTSPKYESESDLPNSADAVSPDQELEACDSLQLAPASRLAFSDLNGSVTLFADGEHYDGQGVNWDHFVRQLCRQHYLERDAHRAWHRDPDIRSTLLQLLQRGVLCP